MKPTSSIDLPVTRLRELDFLRGVAILLVLLRHIPLFEATERMGWIGVDLFFVLSGFLVSGLLFKEYRKFGNIRPKRFLIRRGFKIYPIYYLFYLPYLAVILYKGNLNGVGLLADLTFVQNYAMGWGYAYAASWSLAVEEHFYIGLSLFLWYGVKKKWFSLDERSKLPAILVFVLIACLTARFLTVDTIRPVFVFTATHLRIDSLLAGVLIAFFYYFRPTVLSQVFNGHKILWAIVFVICIGWTPFVEPLSSWLVLTFGFSALYIGFGILLVSFLLSDNMNRILNRLFTKPIVDAVCRVGFCSYSIYIIHTLVITVCHIVFLKLQIENRILFFVTATGFSIFAGMMMTFTFEKYFLRIRERYFPGRT